MSWVVRLPRVTRGARTHAVANADATVASIEPTIIVDEVELGGALVMRVAVGGARSSATAAVGMRTKMYSAASMAANCPVVVPKVR